MRTILYKQQETCHLNFRDCYKTISNFISDYSVKIKLTEKSLLEVPFVLEAVDIAMGSDGEALGKVL